MSNPILNKFFTAQECTLENETMTVTGSALKSIFLLLTIVLSLLYTWNLAAIGYTDKMQFLMFIGLIVASISGLIVVLVKPKVTPILSVIYAISEGMFLGGISSIYGASYHGIVPKAVFLTLLVTGTMLFLYITRIIKMSEKLWSFIVTATASIAVIYLIQIVASFIGRSIPAIFGSGALGIGFSLFVIIIAALNLIADFNIIEMGSKYRLPKVYEWLGAVGLMFTVVWLYLEILRLLSKRN